MDIRTRPSSILQGKCIGYIQVFVGRLHKTTKTQDHKKARIVFRALF